MNRSEVAEIISHCSYKPNWNIHIKSEEDGTQYIQLEVKDGMDSVTLQRTDWKSGKRYLSKWMCRQEIVGVVFGLIKDAEMHEIHEFFRYKGASIYNPHLDPDVLADVAKRKSSFVMRENAMSMIEGAE